MCSSAGSKRVARSETPTSERAEAVRVWLPGGFRVPIGARTIEEGAWRLRKAASLVKLLAASPGYRLHREQAMDILWPDSGRRATSEQPPPPPTHWAVETPGECLHTLLMPPVARAKTSKKRKLR